MKFVVSVLALAVAATSAASIHDGLIVDAREEMLPIETGGKAERIEVVEANPVGMPEEEARMVGEEVAAAVAAESGAEDGVQAVVSGEFADGEEFPRDVVPVVSEDENCEKREEVVDEESALRAERKADEDLLKALDAVLSKRETLEDVLRSEHVPLAQL